MARATLVILLLLSACVTNVRNIDICVLDIPNDIASCAKGEQQYKKQIKQLAFWSAMSIDSYQVIADKLAQCDIDEKLPKEDVFYKLEICDISADGLMAFCTLEGVMKVNEIMYVNEYIATDKTGLNKIQAKLNFCMRNQ